MLRWNSLSRTGHDAIFAAVTHNTTLTSVLVCGYASAESSNTQSAINLLCQRNITRMQKHDVDVSVAPVSPSITSTSPQQSTRALSTSVSTVAPTTRYRDSMSHVILQQGEEDVMCRMQCVLAQMRAHVDVWLCTCGAMHVRLCRRYAGRDVVLTRACLHMSVRT